MRPNLQPSFCLAAILMSAILISSCATPLVQAQQEYKKIKVIDFMNGLQGDKSFFDSAARGISRAEADLGLEVKTIEASYDPASPLGGIHSRSWPYLILRSAGDDRPCGMRSCIYPILLDLIPVSHPGRQDASMPALQLQASGQAPAWTPSPRAI
jgi:hypothetical protein